MTVLVDGKYYEDATYNTQFISVMNGEAVPVPDEVPDPKVADNGKILTVVGGVAAWADAPVELPVSEVEDNGKVLTVNAEGAPTWADAPVELPVSEVEDNGKVLTVNAEGAPVWQEPTHPVQFVIGADEPTNTAVPWIDTTSATEPVLKVYIDNAWVAVVNTAG